MAPFDALWFIEDHERWTPDLDIECPRGTAFILPAFVGRHNVKVFALLHSTPTSITSVLPRGDCSWTHGRI